MTSNEELLKEQLEEMRRETGRLKSQLVKAQSETTEFQMKQIELEARLKIEAALEAETEHIRESLDHKKDREQKLYVVIEQLLKKVFDPGKEEISSVKEPESIVYEQIIKDFRSVETDTKNDDKEELWIWLKAALQRAGLWEEFSDINFTEELSQLEAEKHGEQEESALVEQEPLSPTLIMALATEETGRVKKLGPSNTKPRSLSMSEKIHNLRDADSTALGAYRNWSNLVDLGPPRNGRNRQQIPMEDQWVWDYYNSLQYTLYETGYPETIDRTSSPKTEWSRDDVSVAVLSSPVECIAVLLEGSRQLPGSILLVLSTTWISKLPSETQPLFSLFIHKAITFDRGGHSYVDEYDPPRKTTYLLNYFTGPVTNGQRMDGEEIEEDLDCPTSSSVKLARMAGDKVWTRCVMADVNMTFPETLAFMYKCDRLMESSSDLVRIVHLDKNIGLDNLIQEEVREFIAKLEAANAIKVVVKPSGPEFHGSIGVSYHDIKDITSITSAVTFLLKQLGPDRSVLLETFVDTISPELTDKRKAWGANEDLAVRVRSAVCRGPDDRAVSTQIICGNSSKYQPVNWDNTICQSLDTTLLAYNITNSVERARIIEEINSKSEAVLEGIMTYEKSLSTADKGAVYGQTDLIGLDFIITRRNSIPTLVGIEVNSHGCTMNYQKYEFMNAYLGYDQGESVRPLVQTMITRSQRHVMVGKAVLVIGGGAYSKKDIWPDAAKYGIKIILVDADPNHFAKNQVFQYIQYNYNDHTCDPDHAINIVDKLSNLGLHVDGCVAFWEDCGPLAANVCKIMGLNGNDCNAAFIGKKKSLTQEVLRKKTDDIPHWPRTYLYSSKTQPMHTEADIDRVKEDFSLPIVLKLDYGAGAVAVSLINDYDTLRQTFLKVQNSLKGEEDYGGIGLGFGNSMTVMEYLGGTEHDVDIVIFRRKMIGAFVSDNGPTRVPHFTETATTMPSILPADKVSQLITAAYQCCTEIGLSDGVFNVEFKMTPAGPKLIEINARMGGFYLRDWIKRIYCTDLAFCAMQISCGIKPFIPKVKPKYQIIGVNILPSLHGHYLKEDSKYCNELRRMVLNEEIVWNQFDNEVPDNDNGGYEEPLGNISVVAENLETAREKLLDICEKLNIASDDYDVKYFIRDFVR